MRWAAGLAVVLVLLASGCGVSPEEAAERELVAALKGPDMAARVEALAALKTAGPAAAAKAPLVAGLLYDRSKELKQAVSETLQAMGPAAAAALARVLEDGGEQEKSTALKGLAVMGEAASGQVDLLAAQLQGTAWYVRLEALHTIRDLGPAARTLAGEMTNLLRDPETTVRGIAGEALGAMGAADQIPALVAMLQDEDLNFALAAARSLGNLGALAAPEVSEIAELLSRPGANGRIAGAWALSYLSEYSAAHIDAIGTLLDAPEAQVRTAGVRALAGFGALAAHWVPRIGDQLLDQELRASALIALAQMGELSSSEAHKVFNILREGPQRLALQYTISALARMGEGAYVLVPELIRLLDEPSPAVRIAAAEALTTMGPGAHDHVDELGRRLSREAVDSVASALSYTLSSIRRSMAREEAGPAPTDTPAAPAGKSE